MNLAIDAIAHIIFSFSGILALFCGSIILASLGKERIPSVPSYGISVAIGFLYVIFASRGTGSDGMSDGGRLALVIVATLLYASLFVLAYWIARKQLRPFAHKPVRKPSKDTIPQFAGMRHSRPKKPVETARLR